MSEASGETRTVVVEREFPFPPEKLWRALTQPHLLAEWLMQNDFMAVVGHRFQLRGDWGGVLDCEVLAMEQNRLLSYSWDFAQGKAVSGLQTVVTFILTPTGAGTRLRLEHSGFRLSQKQAFGGAKLGWQKFLGNLEQVLAKSH